MSNCNCPMTPHPIPGDKLEIDKNFNYSLVTNVPDPNRNVFNTLSDDDIGFLAEIFKGLGDEDLERIREFKGEINPEAKEIRKTLEKLLSTESDDIKSVLEKLKNSSILLAIKFLFFWQSQDSTNVNKIEKHFRDLYSKFMNCKDSNHVIIQPMIGALRDMSSEEKFIYTNVYIYENFKNPLLREEFEVRQNYTMGIDGKYQLGYYISYNRDRNSSDNDRSGTYRLHKFSIKSKPFDIVLHK